MSTNNGVSAAQPVRRFKFPVVQFSFFSILIKMLFFDKVKNYYTLCKIDNQGGGSVSRDLSS